ncbi:DNA-binding pseudobarrel domain-containing protein [Tanacetum coccineum]
MKSLDGNETQMSIRTFKQRHCSTQYHLSVGWPAFKRSNNISESDECVFMYTTSEDKMCLAKITKKENVKLVENCMEVDVDDNKDEDENVELVDDGMDGKDVVVDDNKDEDENVKPKSEWLLVSKDQTKSLCSMQAVSTQTDCIQDTAQKMKLKRLKASIATMTRQTDAEQGRPTFKKLEVKQVEFKLGEDCWEIQVKRMLKKKLTFDEQVAMITARRKGSYEENSEDPLTLVIQKMITFDKSKRLKLLIVKSWGSFAIECRFAKYQEKSRANVALTEVEQDEWSMDMMQNMCTLDKMVLGDFD